MIRTLIVCTLLGLGLACRHPSPAVEFHTLRPLASANGAPTTKGTAMRLEVMPVRLPELLLRSQIVVLKQPGVHRLSSTHRWGNTLEKDMQRVLAENLAALLGHEAILFHAGGSLSRATHRLFLDVQQCDGAPGGTLQVRTAWTVVSVGDGQVVLSRRFTFTEAIGEPGFEGLVSAHDRAMESLSREIATAVMPLAIRPD